MYLIIEDFSLFSYDLGNLKCNFTFNLKDDDWENIERFFEKPVSFRIPLNSFPEIYHTKPKFFKIELLDRAVIRRLANYFQIEEENIRFETYYDSETIEKLNKLYWNEFYMKNTQLILIGKRVSLYDKDWKRIKTKELNNFKPNMMFSIYELKFLGIIGERI